MTVHSNYPIEDVWKARTLKSFSRVHFDTELSDTGHGILCKTKKGDVVYDLRLEQSRIFLGHLHPLLAKDSSEISAATSKYQKLATDQIPKFDFILDASNITDEQILSTIYRRAEREVVQIQEKDLVLFQSSPESYLSAHPNIQITKYCSPFNLFYAQPKEGAVPRGHFIFHHLDSFLEQVIFSKAGKFYHDAKLIDEFLIASKLTNTVTRIGRTLMVPSEISASLTNIGVFHSIVSNKAMLSYPLACTKREISDSLGLLKSIL